jgi:hypothetical protein
MIVSSSCATVSILTTQSLRQHDDVTYSLSHETLKSALFSMKSYMDPVNPVRSWSLAIIISRLNRYSCSIAT